MKKKLGALLATLGLIATMSLGGATPAQAYPGFCVKKGGGGIYSPPTTLRVFFETGTGPHVNMIRPRQIYVDVFSIPAGQFWTDGYSFLVVNGSIWPTDLSRVATRNGRMYSGTFDFGDPGLSGHSQSFPASSSWWVVGTSVQVYFAARDTNGSEQEIHVAQSGTAC